MRTAGRSSSVKSRLSDQASSLTAWRFALRITLLISHEEYKVIGAEFGCYGPAGFDTGTFIASLILNSMVTKRQPKKLRLSNISPVKLTYFGRSSRLYPTL